MSKTNPHYRKEAASTDSGREEIPKIDIELEAYTHFNICTLDPEIAPRTEIEPPHRHNFQEIIWIKSGAGSHAIDNQVIPITSPGFYLIAQGQVHQFLRGRRLKGYVIQFTDNFLLDLPVEQSWIFRTALFNSAVRSQTIRVDKAHIRSVENVMDHLHEEYNRPLEFGKYEILRHLLNVLLIQIQRISTEDRESETCFHSSDRAVFLEFAKAIESRYKRDHRIADYAKELQVTVRRLSCATRRFTGKSAKQVLSDRLILEAKRYLSYTNASIKEITHLLGYEDPAHFSRTFKRQAGKSPLDFRKEAIGG